MTEEQQKQAQVAADEFMERCDTNKDGVVEFSEVQAKFGSGWSAEKTAEEKARFDDMDTNKDGKVDKDEFRKWVLDMMVNGSC